MSAYPRDTLMLRRISRKALTCIMVVSGCLVGAAAETDLHQSVERVLIEENLIGIAWALVHETGEQSVGAAGLRDNRADVAFTTSTRFHVGSLTKSLLAIGVLRLATERRIDLDAPALDYLPSLSLGNPKTAFSKVTVRHLLDHTAGLNDAQLWQLFSEHADPDAPLAIAFPDPQELLQVRSKPGSQFSYSNMGYTLLGMIIESVVGDRYETYLDNHVLAPLGMHHSTFTYTTQEGQRADPTLAWGHVDDGSPISASPMFLRPAGQFTTTAADMARFTSFMMSDGSIDGSTFVDGLLMRSRGQPFGTDTANEGLVAGYALGIARRDRHGVVGYCHGGNVVGFVAMLCIFPSEHKGFVFSVNTDSETANYGRLQSLFIDALSIDQPAPPKTAKPRTDISEWYGWYVLSPNRFQMFEYLDTVFGAIRISADGDSLTMTSMQQETRQLRPVGAHLYSVNDRATTSHVVFRGDEGQYLISDGFKTYKNVSTVYLAAHWASILFGLAGLLWLFVAGFIALFRYRFSVVDQPVAPAFLATAMLLLPIPFFFSQSFLALGDFTLASAILAIVTLLLPVGMFLTILLAVKRRSESRIIVLHGLAAAFVLQWCVVLAVADLLPFRLWA
ncbi:MAG: serine hydrolase domain-containing protein [Woeseiaceae bacterium]